jgi:tRNA A-37 threonylcarbamoyl transferase component Bud32/TolA-binding protein
MSTPVESQILPTRYRAPKRIARGGMGEIYRVTDATLGRAVAVKLLAERYSEDEAIRQRFTREALAAARLSGERNVITIFDVGEWDGRPFIVMEYLGGGSLEGRLRDGGAQEPDQALTWLEQAAGALDAAHRDGVVHRDVKPANLLLDREGNVHVADFGIARAAGLDSLTMTGTVLGTAGYLSPEQARGEAATEASDRYALAVVAFELLSGRRPFENDSMTAEASAHVNAPVPSIYELCKELPPQVDAVFQRALAKDPAARYSTAAEFVADLRHALADSAGQTATFAPPPRRPTKALVVVGGLLAAGVLGAVLAALFAGGGDHKQRAVVRTVVRTGPGATVTQERTVTTNAGAPPPPATTEPLSSSGAGHALNDRGYTLMQHGDYAGAVPILRQAVAALRGVGPSDPYEAYANYNLGYSLLRLGSCGEAIPYLSRAQQLEPQRSEPGRDLGRAQACA